MKDDFPLPNLPPDEYDETLVQATILAGQYEIVRKLGEGGMGEVHLAKDLHLNDRFVAIKTLPSLRAASKRAMKQLKREAATMLELTHENIVRFYHFGEHQGLPFMVMQYIQGKTLDDLLDEREKLSENEMIDLMKPIAEALDYAHAKGIIHKDIKPANIFIENQTGKPYLADFGIARVVKDTISQVTGRDATSGTLHYMSPEQCRGAWDLTAASDMYSFATVLYECLMGQVPFHTGPIRELILNQEPPPLIKNDSPLSRQIMKGLAKAESDRPCSCKEFFIPAQGVADVIVPSSVPVIDNDSPVIMEELTGHPQHGTHRTIDLGNGVEINLVYIAPGTFEMGSPNNEKDRYKDEGPVHSVMISKGFWLGETPVTQAQYRTVMGKNPSYVKGDHFPVDQVSWNDAKSFCEKLSRSCSESFRLLCEAEWEYACRAGSTTRFSFGDHDSDLDASAWYDGNADSIGENYAYAAVGTTKPNAWGLYDMHGNVYEWCADWYDENYYANSPVRDPRGPNYGQYRVLRGGSWGSVPGCCRSADRSGRTPDCAYYGHGFRVAMDLP